MRIIAVIGIVVFLAGIAFFSHYNALNSISNVTIVSSNVSENDKHQSQDRILFVKVRKGWSLEDIARGVGMNIEELRELNRLQSDKIYPGQLLKVKPYTSFYKVLVSWYGPGFQGKLMADGKPFDMNDPTIVAHKWLPFGTRVRLTRLDNGKSIEVVVQDRGPYIAERHFDLSLAAAKYLDMINDGVVLCKVEIVN